MATGRIGTTPVLTTRWSKAPAAGTTSLSGLDDNSVSLVYSVGYEQVYRNGTLLSRGNDYTATNGTSITLIDATLAGDIIEVFANQTIPLTDTYSQTVSDGRFIRNTLTTTTGDIIYASAANTPARLGIGSTSQVLTVSGGVPTWATPAGFGTLTAYTPTWTGITIGNGTFSNVGYSQSGDLVWYFGQCLFGSTTSFTGIFKLSLPVNAKGQGSGVAMRNPTMIATFSDTSTGYTYPVQVGVEQADPATNLTFFNIRGSLTYIQSQAQEVQQTVPITFADGDGFFWSVIYRKA